jgi:glycosyltransferase involved in cell wall biosynthesis
MQIIYDHSIFMESRIGGVLRHVLELARGIHVLPDAADVTIDIEAGWHHSPIAARDLPSGVFHGRRVPRFRGSARVLSCLDQIRLRRRLAAITDTDVVLHETLYGNVFCAPRDLKRVVVVHDTIWEDSPDRDLHHRALQKKAASIAAADGVIFVSEATRAGFERNYATPRRSAVIHHGCELRTTRDRQPPPVSGSFLLFVGHRGGYKNWNTLASAFSACPLSRSHAFVSFGPRPTQAEQNFVASLGCASRFLWLGGDDDALADLYAAADCFVYPSRAEGFGIPLVEAAKFGCPVACSDIPPFREVLGEDAHYFDQTEASSIGEAITTAAAAGRTSPVCNGALRRSKRYSWRTSAAATLAFYRDVLADRGVSRFSSPELTS